MAVTVEGLPSVVLDDEYRVVEVNAAARAGMEPLVGEDVLAAFPGSRAVFRPYYEAARRTGRSVEFVQFYGGYVLRLRATPEDDGLRVSWETLAMLDLLTLEGLRRSLDAALRQLESAADDVRRKDLRRSLRVVEGGG